MRKIILLTFALLLAPACTAYAAFAPGDQVTVQRTGTSYDGRDATVLAQRPSGPTIVDINETDATGNVRRYATGNLSPKGTPTPTPAPTATPTATATATPTNTPTVTPTATPTPPLGSACFPDPSACGYPDVDNTGPRIVLQDARFAQLPAGAAWDAQSGVLRITGNNVSLSGLDIPGSVTVDGNGFHLTDSRIHVDSGCSNYPCGNYGIRLGQSGGPVTGTVLSYDDIVVPANIGLRNATGAVKVEFAVRNNGDSAAQADHVYMAGFSDAWHAQGSITNSYLTGQEVAAGDHVEALINGGEGNPTVLSHNTILMPPSSDGTNGSADLAFYNDFGGIGRVDVINNLLGGGGFLMYGGAKNGTGNVNGPVTVRGNRITRAYFPNGGSFGLWSEFNPSATTSCENVWDEDSSPAPEPPGATC